MLTTTKHYDCRWIETLNLKIFENRDGVQLKYFRLEGTVQALLNVNLLKLLQRKQSPCK